jgi:predicted AlkP superfamily pyrophosphatase or phosphodiesterase
MKKNLIFWLLCLFLALTGCKLSVEDPQEQWLAKHVIFIVLDGWGAYSVKNAEMPQVEQLMAFGAYTTKKRSVLPSSSAVNWATMLNGSCPELHGYLTWDAKEPMLPARVLNQNGHFPTIFSLLRDAYPGAVIGCEYEWSGIRHVIDEKALDFNREVLNALENPDSTAIIACNYIREAKPNLFAVIFDEPDHVGHKSGHDTPDYYAMLKKLDAYIGQIVQTVKDAGIYDDTIFIITADHGGINQGHGSTSMEEMETPFIIAGKNVKKGLNFDEISMMQFDVASTIAYIFQLEQPQVWIGRPVKQVFIED